MNVRKLDLALGLVCCALSGAGCITGDAPGTDDVAAAAAAIQGGQLETGYPAVGEIHIPGAICTGALIAPSYVLTAAHCAGTGMEFRTGTDASNFVAHPVDQQVAHPTLDLLIAHLAAPITGILPLPVNASLPPAIGAVCTAVGFGRHESGGVTTNGVKRSATERVTAVDPSTITVEFVTGVADHGDSGGPLVCSGEITSVVREHDDGEWPAHRIELYTPVDASWIITHTPRALGQGPLGTVPGATAVAAYYGGGDGLQRVVGGTASGALTQYWFAGGGGVSNAPLTAVPAEVALAGYYAPSDTYHHVISAGSDGSIREVFFKPGVGLGQGVLTTIPGAVSLGAYYAPSDGYQHVIVGTSSGEVREVYFKPGSGQPVRFDTLGWIGGIISVGAYYAPSDGFQHILVGTSGGQVWELYFRPGQGVGTRLLSTIPGLVSVTGYFASSDNLQHVIMAAGDGTLHELRYATLASATIYGIYGTVPGVQRIAGYYGAGDGYEHVIALTSGGTLIEAFTRP